MALTKCPECKNEVSDKAEVCPKCGIQIYAQYWTTGRIIVLIVFVLVAFLFFLAYGGDELFK